MAALSAFFLALAVSTAPAGNQSDDPTPNADQCLVKLSVPDMSCPMGCSPVVTRALKSIKGVDQVKVKFADKLAHVIANKPICNEAGTQTMVKAVKAKGYQCEVAKSAKKKPKA